MTNKKLNLGIFSNEKKKSDDAYIALDKQGRVYLNANAQKFFGIEKGKSVDIQLGYVDGVIYMVKPGSEYADENAKPFRFSGERAYASAKSLIESLNIAPQGDKKSEKYFHDESFNEYEGVFAFKHESLMQASKEVAAATEKPKAASTKKPAAAKKDDKKDDTKAV